MKNIIRLLVVLALIVMPAVCNAQYELYYGALSAGVPAITYANISATDEVNIVVTVVGNGNSSWTQTGNGFARATISKSTGLWYWEADATQVGGNLNSMGICLMTDAIGTFVGGTANSWGWLPLANGVYHASNELLPDHMGSYGPSARLCFAMDLTNRFLYIGTITAGVTTWCKNTSNVTGVPTSGALGTGAVTAIPAGSFAPAFGDNANSKGTAYFNPIYFNGTPPAGYGAIQ